MSLRLCLSRAILFAAAVFLAAPALAAVFERDFVPGSGDGLLTYDDVNGREWLDVTVFADEWSSWDAFLEAWEDPAFDFTQEFPELAPGGIYEGFALAGKEDVMSLAESAGIDTSTARFETNDLAANRLVGLLGVTLDRFPWGGSSIGFIDEFIEWGFPPWQVRVQAEFVHIRTSRAGLVFNSFGDSGSESIGLMLYRVPEPSTAYLCALSIFVLVSIRGWTARRDIRAA